MTKRRAVVLAVVAVLLCADGPLGGAAPEPPGQVAYRFAGVDRAAKLATAFSEIDALFRAFAARSRVPGIAWGILVDGQLVHEGAVGVRDLASRAPVDAGTVFRIASMTKSFTAVAILRLRDEGKLSLDDLAERFVPELAGLKYPTADSPRLTIRHLLSHAGGFPEDNPWGDRQLAATDDEMGRMMRQGIPFSTAPGTSYEYSNYGFAILGRIVGKVSGEPYARYVKTHVLDPLGMLSTSLQPASVPAATLAHGYRWEDDTWKDEPALPDGAFGAMGGMLTSTRDLAKYVGFLMAAWPPRDEPERGPIRRSSAREMQQVWRPSPATVTRDATTGAVRLNTGGYGFGLRVWQTCDLPHVVAHSGGLPGFGSHMRWLPEHGVGIVAMGNLTYTSWGRIVDQAFDRLAQTGGLTMRVPVAAHALVVAQESVTSLVTRWDEGVADTMAADNLYMDESKDRWRARLAEVASRHGACRLDAGSLVPENALRGSWTMTCDRGWLRVSVTLAPTVPARVQYWSVVPSMEPRPAPPARGQVCGG
jgi:CubicO group peptidase (beta-lactamase class C family)